MVVNNIISPSLIFLDEDLKSKDDIIFRIAKVAKENNYIIDEKVFYNSVMAREDEVPTAIGYGVAIPHGKNDTVQSPFIAFFRTNESITWTEGFDDTVRLVFQIGVPETGTEKLHLKFISQVSKKLLDDDFRKKLLLISSKTEVYNLLKSISL